MREWWRVKIHGRVVLASSHVDSMRHNTEMIRTLSEAPK
jgi:hypothetical protein